MIREGPAFPRKPLTIGEIAERSFSLYARVPLPCIALSILSAVPGFAFLQVAASVVHIPATAAPLNPIIPTSNALAGATAATMPSVTIPGVVWWLGIVWAVTSVLVGIVLSNVLFAAYTENRLDFVRVARMTLRRFLPTLAILAGAYLAMVASAYAAALVVAITYGIVAVGLHLGDLGVMLCLIEGIIALLYLVPTWTFLLQLIWVTYAVSEPHFVKGLALIFSVTFSPLTRRRSYLFALAVLGIALGSSLIAGAAYEVAMLATKSVNVGMGMQLLVQALTTPVMFAMFVIFIADAAVKPPDEDPVPVAALAE